MDANLKQIQRLGKFLNALASVSPPLAGKLAFRIFCTPRRLPVREQDAAFLAGARQDFLHVRNLRISTYSWEPESSNGRTALLLHGWESNSARWSKFIKAFLAEGYAVQAIDAPASGYSQGKQLNVLLLSAVVRDHILKKGRPYIMVGHSLGGAAAVMSTAMLGAPTPEKMILMGVFAETKRVTLDFARILGANDRVVEAIYREIETRSGLPIEAYSVAQKAATLAGVKGLVIHDLQDNVAPVEEGRKVAATWGVELVETDGLGHRLQDKSVVKTVLEFASRP